MLTNRIKVYKWKLIPIALILVTNTCFSSFEDVPIEQDINESSLIIKGKLIDKYYQRREGSYIASKDGSVYEGKRQKLFTIFVFSVEEMLKGEYENDSIEVMMLGGCENGDCFYISSGYSYDLGEDAVLFLKERRKYPFTYIALGAASTVYSIDSRDRLLRKSLSESESNEKKQSIKTNKDGKYSIEEQMTIGSLKSLINQELKQ